MLHIESVTSFLFCVCYKKCTFLALNFVFSVRKISKAWKMFVYYIYVSIVPSCCLHFETIFLILRSTFFLFSLLIVSFLTYFSCWFCFVNFSENHPIESWWWVWKIHDRVIWARARERDKQASNALLLTASDCFDSFFSVNVNARFAVLVFSCASREGLHSYTNTHTHPKHAG